MSIGDILLRIAEGFVKVKEGNTLEKVAEAYLYELLNRSCFKYIAETGYDGKPSSCHMHDFLREIVLSKSRE